MYLIFCSAGREGAPSPSQYKYKNGSMSRLDTYVLHLEPITLTTLIAALKIQIPAKRKAVQPFKTKRQTTAVAEKDAAAKV